MALHEAVEVVGVQHVHLSVRRLLGALDAGAACRVTRSRLVPGFSVRTWEIQQEKSH
eukprot:SAG31_NODE_20827_length_564_cov_1.475269_1_plen_56_part_01